MFRSPVAATCRGCVLDRTHPRDSRRRSLVPSDASASPDSEIAAAPGAERAPGPAPHRASTGFQLLRGTRFASSPRYFLSPTGSTVRGRGLPLERRREQVPGQRRAAAPWANGHHGAPRGEDRPIESTFDPTAPNMRACSAGIAGRCHRGRSAGQYEASCRSNSSPSASRRARASDSPPGPIGVLSRISAPSARPVRSRPRTWSIL